uniref:Uncharacterized protein n=1 Tax=Rhizophora mucronata TaxID=61149 RepID=A0A2P2QJ52_RHIMU
MSLRFIEVCRNFFFLNRLF